MDKWRGEVICTDNCNQAGEDKLLMNLGSRDYDISNDRYPILQAYDFMDTQGQVAVYPLTIIAGSYVKQDMLWLLYKLSIAADQLLHNIKDYKMICNELLSCFEDMYRNPGMRSGLENNFRIEYRFSYRKYRDSSITLERGFLTNRLRCYVEICYKQLSDLSNEELEELSNEKGRGSWKKHFIAYDSFTCMQGLQANMDINNLYELKEKVEEYYKETKDSRIDTLISDIGEAFSALYQADWEGNSFNEICEHLMGYNKKTLNPNEIILMRFITGIVFGLFNMANDGESTLLLGAMDYMQKDIRTIAQRILFNFISLGGRAVVIAKESEVEYSRHAKLWGKGSLLSSVALHAYSYEVETQKGLNRYKSIINKAYRIDGNEVQICNIGVEYSRSFRSREVNEVILETVDSEELSDLMELDKFIGKFGI